MGQFPRTESTESTESTAPRQSEDGSTDNQTNLEKGSRKRVSLLEKALAGEKTSRPPVWLMRQAGRTDPEYIQLKQEVGFPLEDMFSNPEIATRVSLLPRKLGVDALIFFQDILTILGPMGAPFKFRPGPILERPIRTKSEITSLKHFDVAKELSFVPKTLNMLKDELAGTLPVLGFAGAPFTLAVFLIQGQSFGSGVRETKEMMLHDPELLKSLIQKLTPITIDYLKMQAEAGVVGVQLFESAAFLLGTESYKRFALPAQQAIYSALKGIVPTINFAHNFNDLKCLGDAGADVISLSNTVSITASRELLGSDQIIQGNVSNQLLATGGKDDIQQAVRACLIDGQNHRHIFNLDHGLLKTTPFENVQEVVTAAKKIGAELFSQTPPVD